MQYKRGILVVLVVLILLSLVFSPGLSADEKSYGGIDLAVVDMRFFNLARYQGNWNPCIEGTIKNIGDDDYSGEVAYVCSIYHLFSLKPIDTSGRERNYDIAVGKEITTFRQSLNSTAIGDRILPQFYRTTFEIFPENDDNPLNNKITQYYFTFGFLYWNTIRKING